MNSESNINANLYRNPLYKISSMTLNIRGFAIFCLLMYGTVNILFWSINGSIVMRVIGKILQIGVALIGFQCLTKVYKQRIFRDLLFFDAAYFITCLVNPNLIDDLKVFVHFFILQGVCFYTGYVWDRKTMRMIMKWIVVFSTFVAVLNNLFIIFPIGISSYSIGYIFGRNYGFFAGSSAMLGALHAITCVYLFYSDKYKTHKGPDIILFVINYVALISNSTRGDYLIATVGIGAISSLRLIRSFHYKMNIRRQLRFFMVILLVGGITLGSGKYQPLVYTFFGNLLEEETQAIAHGIDAILLVSGESKPYMIINSGTKKILINRTFASEVTDLENGPFLKKVVNQKESDSLNADILKPLSTLMPAFVCANINLQSSSIRLFSSGMHYLAAGVAHGFAETEVANPAEGVLSVRDVTDSGSMSIRVTMWKEAIMAWRMNPIFGVGRANAGIYAQEIGTHWMNESNESSHNSWLNVLLWSGIVGAFLFGRFVLDVIRLGKQNIRNKIFPVVLVLGFVLYMILYPGLIYTSSMLSLILWVSLGCICRQERE